MSKSLSIIYISTAKLQTKTFFNGNAFNRLKSLQIRMFWISEFVNTEFVTSWRRLKVDLNFKSILHKWNRSIIENAERNQWQLLNAVKYRWVLCPLRVIVLLNEGFCFPRLHRCCCHKSIDYVLLLYLQKSFFYLLNPMLIVWVFFSINIKLLLIPKLLLTWNYFFLCSDLGDRCNKNKV